MVKNKAVPILIGAGIATVALIAAVSAKKPPPPPEEYSAKISNIKISEV